METNDNTPKSDEASRPQETEQHVDNSDTDDDIHVCRKCNFVFHSIQKYLEHKIKHDNFKVQYTRSEVDKRMIMPKLIQRPPKKPVQEIRQEPPIPDEEKENNGNSIKQKAKRGRKRTSEIHDQHLVITEKPVYSCEKCGKKFNREATLKRHINYDHNEDDSDAEDDTENVEDDQDMEYKPTETEIKEEELADHKDDLEVPEEVTELDSLDQVIFAAALMEKTQGTDPSAQTVSISTQDGQIINAVITQKLDSNQIVEGLVPRSAKRQKLSEEDRALRKFTCVVCGNKFKDLAVLKAHMVTHSAQRNFVCEYENCPYSFKTKGSLKRHIRRHTGERPYPCELCGRSFAESGALTRHLKSRTPCTSKSDNDLPRYGKKWRYTPNIPAVNPNVKLPPNTTEQVGDLQKNMTEINRETTVEEVTEVALPVDDSGSKDQLSAMSAVVQVLEDALQVDHGEELYDIGQEEGIEIVIEGTVNDAIISDDCIGQFVQTDTAIGETHVCRVCGEEFTAIENLKIHLRTHLADEICRCWLCHFNTEDKEEFANHMFVEHHLQIKNSDPLLDLAQMDSDTAGNKNSENQDPYKLTPQMVQQGAGETMLWSTSNKQIDAQVAVKQLIQLEEEMSKSNQDNNTSGHIQFPGLSYKCPVCMRTFRGSKYLKLHMRSHTGLKPYKCTECNKTFITKDSLNKHMSTHVDDRQFKCGECGKLFKRLSHVREHIKIHSGIRPFPCTICKKSFKTNNAMKVHLRTHSDILPYECTYCHRRFREKGSVLRHTRLHTGEKPYECKYCGRCFAEHGTLNRHLKAKVSCTKELQEIRDRCQEDSDNTVLAEFSSVVADTQQYMIPESDLESSQMQESLSQPEDLLQSTELQLEQQNQATEYVLLQAGDEEQVQNLEIVTDEGGQSVLEGVEVAGDYFVITDPDGKEMKIVDNQTGQVIAIVPVAGNEESGSEIQTITLPDDGVISTVNIDTDMDVSTEIVTLTELETVEPSTMNPETTEAHEAAE